jgi:heme A synthase
MKGGDILAIGFGTTVAMWGAAYLARLPVVSAPPALVLVLLLAALVAGGYVAGLRGGRGVRGGVYGGALTGLLNLLVLGSFLSTPDRENGLVPSAGIWIPGAFCASAMLGAVGAFWGRRRRQEGAVEPDWTGWLARVAVGATFLLIVAGGLVTGNKAGLAVADWPTSYGYNMFLYPFSRMTGGIYYEHAHRLLGALVGLTTLSLAVHPAMVETRPFVKRMGAAAVVLVVVQGILGGLRVTERSLHLAVVHGVTAQVFLSLLVAIAVVRTTTWRSDRPRRVSAHAGNERTMATRRSRRSSCRSCSARSSGTCRGLILHIVSAFAVAALTVSAGVRVGAALREPVLRGPVDGGLVTAPAGARVFRVDRARRLTSGALSPEWTILVTTLTKGRERCSASTVTLRLWLSRLLASGSQPSS